MSKLAINGGTPVKTTPFGTGKRFGSEELTQLSEALEQNTLFYWSGKKVKQLCEKFAAHCGTKYCVAASSGTAALHVALGALGITAGDEVITSPITDMGSVIGIMYQNALPVFADLDMRTYNLDPKSVEEKITPRTKAIIVVNLAGNPADMDGIMDVAHRHGIYVIEDCAQAYNCYYKGRMCGSIGDIGCFSLNDFKHISAGDGGMVVMNDEQLYYKAFRFADKNYNRFGGTLREIEYLAPNYRMNELTAAVGIAQLEKLDSITSKREKYGNALTAALSEIPGILPPKIYDNCRSSYWFYMLRVEDGIDRNAFSVALKAEGIPNIAGYIPACVYEYDIFKNKNAYPGTHCLFECPYRPVTPEYKTGICPNAEKILRTAIKLNINEFYTQQDLEQTIEAVRKVASELCV